MQAAAEVFAEKGYDRAGVAEIARRAGLTTGAIYSRYAGKADLLAAAIVACVPDEFDQLFAEHAFEGRAKDLLTTVGAHLVTRGQSPMRGVLLEAFVAARRDPEVAAALRGQFAIRLLACQQQVHQVVVAQFQQLRQHADVRVTEVMLISAEKTFEDQIVFQQTRRARHLRRARRRGSD